MAQKQHLESTDPTEAFLDALKQAMGTKTAHLRSLRGGTPRNATQYGWTEETSTSELPQYRSHGPCIGWVDIDKDELYLDANLSYSVLRKLAPTQVQLTRPTLWKRMKDGSLLTRVSPDNRNTVRVTAEGHPRTAIVLSLSATMQVDEEPMP